MFLIECYIMDLKRLVCCMSRSNDGRNIIKDAQSPTINNGLSGAQTNAEPIINQLNEDNNAIEQSPPINNGLSGA